MNARQFWLLALCLLASATGRASGADTVPLADMTAPWLALLRSGDPPVRAAATKALGDIVRKHPAAARDLVRSMATEDNAGVAAEHEQSLVPLAKESPATVSALIRLIRERETNYRARNFGVKVLSQVGPAVGTKEFIDSMAETYCPVPGAFLRILRALGKESAPILAAAYRHPDANVRKWSTIGIRVVGRTEPTIKVLAETLAAEPALLEKLRTGTSAERVSAVGGLAELARTTPGTTTLLVNALQDVSDQNVLTEAQHRLTTLGRESSEVVLALLAGIRNEDSYRVRSLAVKVLPRVGSMLNCKETVAALGDDSCPVPGTMRRILLAAGPDALPVLQAALQHTNPVIRSTAQSILQRMPRPAPQQ